MIHLLLTDPPGVDDGTEAVGGALFARQARRNRQHPAEQGSIGFVASASDCNVALRNDQEMHRRMRMDVVEGEHVVVFVHLLRRESRRARSCRRCSRPSDPSNRRCGCSSRRCRKCPRAGGVPTSTSSTVSPNCDSRIMLWNHRSVTSHTRCRRSPSLAAMMVSAASSAIFLQIASVPLA